MRLRAGRTSSCDQSVLGRISSMYLTSHTNTQHIRWLDLQHVSNITHQLSAHQMAGSPACIWHHTPTLSTSDSRGTACIWHHTPTLCRSDRRGKACGWELVAHQMAGSPACIWHHTQTLSTSDGRISSMYLTSHTNTQHIRWQDLQHVSDITHQHSTHQMAGLQHVSDITHQHSAYQMAGSPACIWHHTPTLSTPDGRISSMYLTSHYNTQHIRWQDLQHLFYITHKHSAHQMAGSPACIWHHTPTLNTSDGRSPACI